MKKLRAFTLIELLVSMSIGSIVVSASYFCYSMVTRQFNTYRIINDEALDVVLFRSLLSQDVSRFPIMKASSEYSIELSNLTTRIVYSFGNDKVTRIQNSTSDTFNLSTSGLQLLFEGEKPVTGVINELNFIAQFPDTSYVMHFVKEYDPGILMKEQQAKIIF
jgi:prepilin-type N-terminal cleavage/methylation domain-containing protein